MLAAIFNFTGEWNIDSLFIEESGGDNEENQQSRTQNSKSFPNPDENQEIFRDEEDNLTIAECF